MAAEGDVLSRLLVVRRTAIFFYVLLSFTFFTPYTPTPPFTLGHVSQTWWSAPPLSPFSSVASSRKRIPVLTGRGVRGECSPSLTTCLRTHRVARSSLPARRNGRMARQVSCPRHHRVDRQRYRPPVGLLLLSLFHQMRRSFFFERWMLSTIAWPALRLARQTMSGRGTKKQSVLRSYDVNRSAERR